MKHLLLLFFILLSNILSAQTTAIPDPAFEQVLVDLEIDSDNEVNGHINTADALDVTTLTIVSSYDNDTGSFQWINNLTGIEAFINLDSLEVHSTMIEELKVSTLLNLKYLSCTDNMLTSIDVSNNTLLEYLDITSGGDVLPFNSINEINLSSNPNIMKLFAVGTDYINLKNGNNNPNMIINVSSGIWGAPLDVIFGHTCIEVDNEALAQSNQFPYSEWTIYHLNQSYSLVESCTAGITDFKNDTITLYPNPATNILNITCKEPIAEAAIYNLLGQKVKYLQAGSTSLTADVSSLTAGTYFIVVKTNTGSSTEKVIIK